MEEMNAGEALAIVKDIYRTDKSVIRKKQALRIVMDMPTINSVTKDNLQNAVRWLMGMPERKAAGKKKPEQEAAG